MPLDIVKAHTPFTKPGEASREIAAVRSPILDLPVNDWPEDNKGEEKPTPLSWLMDTAYEFLPLAIVPFTYQYILRKLNGGTVNPFSGVQPENATREAIRRFNLAGSNGYSNRVEKIENLREMVRVSGDAKSGFKLSIAVDSIDMADYITKTHSVLYRHLLDDATDEDRRNVMKMSGVGLIKWLGKEAVDPAKPVDMRIPPKEFFESGAVANKQLLKEIVEDSNKEMPAYGVKLTPEFGFTDEEVEKALDYLIKNLTSVRLLGSPTAARSGLSLSVNTDKLGEDGRPIAVTIADPESALTALADGHKAAFLQYYIGVQDSRTWYLYLEFDVPAWVPPCLFGTNASSDPVVPADMALWIQQWMHYRQSGENVWLYRRINDIAKHNDSLVKSGVQPKPRTNADGLTIHPDLLALWVPPSLPTVDDYMKVLQSNVSPYTNEFTFKNPELMNAKRHEGVLGSDIVLRAEKQGLPPNQLIYIDWFNNKLSYTNTSGIESILDLERCMPSKPYTMVQLMSTIVFGEGSSTESNKHAVLMISNLLRHAIKHHGFNPLTVFQAALSDEAKAQMSRLMSGYAWDEVYEGLREGDMHVLMAALCGTLWKTYQFLGDNERPAYSWVEDLSSVHLYELHSKNTDIPLLAAVGTVIEDACAKINPEAFIKQDETNVVFKLQAMAMHVAISKYSGRFKEVVEADKADRAVYLNPKKPDPDYKPSGFVLTANGLEFMPHQARIADELQPSPMNAILDVKAGGGKTIQILTNIAYEIGKGNVKRPLVMCPSHLVKDYVNEANYTFAGRFNVIVVNNESLSSWGEDKILKLVKGAPPNTIVVTDFNFLSSRLDEVHYGNNTYSLSLNCELLRLCDFDGVWVDEIHYLRNVNQRSISAQRLLSEIPFKRGASGTLVVTQLTDLVNEIALFDPTLFGSKSRFIEDYAERMSGGRVSVWKPGAEQAIHRKISEHCLVVRAARKEWASLLPPRIERFHYVGLTAGQRGLYESILATTLDKIKEDDPETYAKLIANRKGSSEEDDAALEQLVRRYLARLETFLGAPGEDQDANLLSEEDKQSPKGKKMFEIMREHLSEKIPGKVLIYCSNHKVVKALIEQMPKDLRAMTIQYTAQNKFKDAQEFRKNDQKRFMIGIEDSMRTGLNLQFASRIIRIQSVWTPGDLEQGESRINRPNLKDGTDLRTALYYDHIIVNRTIDVTKTARLIAYMISSAKFENPYEPAYQNIPSPELVSMSFDNLMSENDFADTLQEHMDAFKQLRGVQEEEYRKYREDPKIPKEFKTVEAAPAPKGSGLLKEVPYVSGMELFGAEELGLEPYYDHLRNNSLETSEGLPVHTEWGDGTVTREYKGTITVQLSASGTKVSVKKMAAFVINRASVSSKSIRQQILKLTGMAPVNVKDVSTTPVSPVIGEAPVSRQGISRDDEVLNVAAKKPHPKALDFKLQIQAPPFKVWKIEDAQPYYVVTKANNPFKIKEGQRNIRVYKEDGAWVWIDEDNEAMTGGAGTSKATVMEAIKYLQGVDEEGDETQEEPTDVDTSEEYKGVIPPVSDIDHEFYLGLGVLNGEFFISYNGDDEEAAHSHLQKFGFKVWNRYPTWYIEIRRAAQLRSLIEQMEEKYTIKDTYLQPLKDALSLFNQGKQRMLHPNAAITSEFRNFLRDHAKPPTSPNEIKPYIYVSEEDGAVEFYVVVDARSPAANKLNNRVKIPGTRWYKETDTWLGAFVQKREQIRVILQDMIKAGLDIANLDEVKDQYNRLNPQRRRHTNAE